MLGAILACSVICRASDQPHSPLPRWPTTGKPAPRARATRRSRPARAPSSPAPTTARPWRSPIPTAASNGRPRAISPRPSPTTTRRSRPIRSSRPPTTTAASPTPPRAEYDKAIADYDKAIELNPTYASALNNRGLAYFNNGQKERAIADYDAAIKIEPDAVRLNNRGNAYAAARSTIAPSRISTRR